MRKYLCQATITFVIAIEHIFETIFMPLLCFKFHALMYTQFVKSTLDETEIK